MYSNSSLRAMPLCDWHWRQMRAYLLCGPSPTKYSTTRSMYPRSRGNTGLGKGGPGGPLLKADEWIGVLVAGLDIGTFCNLCLSGDSGLLGWMKDDPSATDFATGAGESSCLFLTSIPETLWRGSILDGSNIDLLRKLVVFNSGLLISWNDRHE